MTKLKRVLVLALSVLVLLSATLTGCGASQEQKSVDNGTTTGQDAQESTAQSNQLPPVTLAWYLLFPQQRDQDAVFAEVNKYLKEKINTQIDFRTLDWGNYNQKLQTAAASGEEFDLLWISDWMDVKYADFAMKGAIIPIDDLLPKYAPETQKFINQKFWDMMKIDDKIYGVPCYQIFSRTLGMWMRKDLVEKYNFDYKNVKSYADFEPFFQAIVDGEPGVTPIAANGIYMNYFPYNSKLAVGGGLPDLKVLGPGINAWASDLTKAFWEYADPELSKYFFDTMKVARDWYLKGFVRRDLLSIQDLDPEIKAGKFAVGFNVVKPGGEGEYKDKYGFDVVFVQTGVPELSGVTATEMAISATSKNPERAMMLIELLNTDKYLFNLLANGIEGANYVKTGENKIARVENNGYQPGLDWALGNTTLGYITPGKPDDVFEQTIKINNEAKPPIMPDWNFNPENIKSEEAASTTIWKEMGNPLWAGVLDPDTEFTKYVERMKNAGVDKMLKEVQVQLDEYWKTHKQ